MWIRMEKISRTDCVKNDEVLRGVKEESNILDTVRKADWTGNVLLSNYVLKHVIEGKIAGTEEKKEEVSSYCVT
jgi:hypothetical protein